MINSTWIYCFSIPKRINVPAFNRRPGHPPGPVRMPVYRMPHVVCVAPVVALSAPFLDWLWMVRMGANPAQTIKPEIVAGAAVLLRQ